MVGVVHAINAGGSAYEATDGIRYDADRDFTGGSGKTRANEITGTDDDEIYQTYREGNATYRLPVTPGAYEVTVHFAETFQNNPGARILTVRVGDVEMRDIDVLAAVGKNAAYQITIPVSVTGTELTVETVGQKKKAILAAIVVREAE